MSFIDLSNSIKVNKSSKSDVSVSTKNKFFLDPVIIKFENNRLVFTKPNLDYSGKVKIFTQIHKDYLQVNLNEKLPFGQFYFDEEESNEDIKVVYFD